MANEIKKLIYGRAFEEEPTEMLQVYEPDIDVTVKGKIIHVSRRDNINGRSSIGFRITDYTDILLIRFFVRSTERSDLLKKLKRDAFIVVKGTTGHDLFDAEVGIEDVYGIYMILDFEPLDDMER